MRLVWEGGWTWEVWWAYPALRILGGGSGLNHKISLLHFPWKWKRYLNPIPFTSQWIRWVLDLCWNCYMKIKQFKTQSININAPAFTFFKWMRRLIRIDLFLWQKTLISTLCLELFVWEGTLVFKVESREGYFPLIGECLGNLSILGRSDPAKKKRQVPWLS